MKQSLNKHPLTVNDLVVVDFPSKNEVHEHIGWKDKRLWGDVLVAEKCARNIWGGPSAAFEDFPLPQGEEGTYQRLEGKEAYAHLLRFMLGFVNPTGYDGGAIKHFHKYFAISSTTHRQKFAHLQPLAMNLLVDYSIMAKQIQPLLKSKSRPMVARDLVGQKSGDVVLIIGDVEDDNTKPTDLTQGVAVATNGNGLRTPGAMDVMHPDEVGRFVLQEGLSQTFTKKGMNIRPFSLPFDHLRLVMEFADCVYVTLEMDKNPEADKRLVEAWKARESADGMLAHLKAAKGVGAKSKSSKIWAKASLDNYVSPEDISREIECREDDFEYAVERVEDGTRILAKLRALGKQTSGRDLASAQAVGAAMFGETWETRSL